MRLPRQGCVVCGRPRGPRGGEMPIAALCRHSTQQAGEIHAVGRRCQIRVSQFASLFVSFSVLLVETQPFPPDRLLRADEHESSRRRGSAPTVFLAWKRRVGDLQGERAEGCGPGLTQATPRHSKKQSRGYGSPRDYRQPQPESPAPSSSLATGYVLPRCLRLIPFGRFLETDFGGRRPRNPHFAALPARLRIGGS